MMYPTFGSFIERQIDAYEQAFRESPDVDVAQFLPVRGHPEYISVLTELLRVCLELKWRNGQSLYLDEIIERFPDLLTQKVELEALAFEEYRQRRLTGERVEVSDYEKNYALSALQWPRVDPMQRQAECEC